MNITRFKLLFFAISLVVIVPGLLSLMRFGLKQGIDFTGGSVLEVKLVQPGLNLDADQVKEQLATVYEVSSVQTSGTDQWLLKGKEMTNDQKQLAVAVLNQNYGPVQELRFETLGPVLGRELLMKMLTAVLIVATFITLYLARQFKELKYGVCAVLAVLHDTLVLLGVFSLLGYFWGVEVDILFVTALLTTVSFSVHDTIVVYDRIRELKRKHPSTAFGTLVNTAVLQTLGRSINNSMTIIIMLATLVALGGESIRWFAVALLVGAVTGTYSSTFTAVPLLLAWEDVKKYGKTSSK